MHDVRFDSLFQHATCDVLIVTVGAADMASSVQDAAVKLSSSHHHADMTPTKDWKIPVASMIFRS